MKKLVFFACLILTAELLSAQLYSGIKSRLAFPLNNEQEIDYGIGAGLQLGYSVGEHLELEIGAGNVWYKSMFQNYRVRSVEAGARYSVFNYPENLLSDSEPAIFKKNSTALSILNSLKTE